VLIEEESQTKLTLFIPDSSISLIYSGLIKIIAYFFLHSGFNKEVIKAYPIGLRGLRPRVLCGSGLTAN
jgi:hypothetical protein